jgi:hypothetical protein
MFNSDDDCDYDCAGYGGRRLDWDSDGDGEIVVCERTSETAVCSTGGGVMNDSIMDTPQSPTQMFCGVRQQQVQQPPYRELHHTLSGTSSWEEKTQAKRLVFSVLEKFAQTWGDVACLNILDVIGSRIRRQRVGVSY